MKPIDRNKILEKILEVTKRYVKNGDKFNDYVQEKNNLFYLNQLPLISSSFTSTEKETSKEKIPNVSLQCTRTLLNHFSTSSINGLGVIRNLSVRPKTLPPLCPMYNSRGKLLPEVIETSRITALNQYKSLFTSDIFHFKKLTPLKFKLRKTNLIGDTRSMEGFQNEILNDIGYRTLIYNEKEIFNNLFEWQLFIKEKVESLIREKTENSTEQLEKIYTLEKGNSNVILRLKSLCVKFIPIEKEENQKELIYYFPLSLLPIFYIKGITVFMILLTKIIKFKDDKFDDFDINNEEIFKVLRESNLYEPLNQIDLNTINEQNEIPQIAIPEGEKGPMITLINQPAKNETVIIPNNNTESFIDSNFSYFNVYYFKWITPKRTFNVEVSMPLATFVFENNRVEVRKVLDMEMMMFLYKKNFLFWDFYIINYLFTFQLFRQVIKKNFSHNKEVDHVYYLKEINKKEQNENSTSFDLVYTDNENKNFFARIEPLKYKINYVNKELYYENEFVIKFNFAQMKKILTIENSRCFTSEKFINRFILINSDFSNLFFNYLKMDEFPVEEWVSEYQKYNRMKDIDIKEEQPEKIIEDKKVDESDLICYSRREIVNGVVNFYDINQKGNLIKSKKNILSIETEKILQQSDFSNFINEALK